MQEIWKDVIGYEGLYKVSNLGNVISINYNGTKKSKHLSKNLNHKGYEVVHLTKTPKSKHVFVHRLVAMSFIPNPNNLPQVNHTGLIKKEKQKGYHRSNSRSVNQYDLNGNFIKHWDYILEAAKELNISFTSIYHNCNGQIKKPKLFIWKYAD